MPLYSKTHTDTSYFAALNYLFNEKQRTTLQKRSTVPNFRLISVNAGPFERVHIFDA